MPGHTMWFTQSINRVVIQVGNGLAVKLVRTTAIKFQVASERCRIGSSLRHVAPMSLANAFEKPVTADLSQSLTEQSVQRLQKTDQKLSAVYSDGRDQWLYLDLTGQWQDNDQSEAVPNLVQLAQRVRDIADTALEA